MHLPKLEGLSLKIWYVAQLHELITKCFDGLSPRWNQTKTTFSYDNILTINNMGYVDKHTTIRFLILKKLVSRSTKSIKHHNIITSFFEAILLSSIYSLSYYFSIIIILFLLSSYYWFDYFINNIMKIILFIH